MKKTVLLALAAIIFCAGVGLSGAAQAQPKVWIFGWGPEYYHTHDFEPYLDDAKLPHYHQWDGRNWKPQDWIQQKKGELKMMRSLYFSEIISDQYYENDVPVLEVGPNFYNLSGYDRERVAELVDHVYNITGENKDGIFMLYDWDTEKPIGVYSAYGLSLQ